jgi:hypothetical protein
VDYSFYRQPSNQFEEDCSNDCRNSCIRQISDVSSDFFRLDNCSASEECDISENVEEREVTDLLKDLPQVESFIIPKKRDSFFTKFMEEVKDMNKANNNKELLVAKQRMKRWLKNHDRKMFEIILALTASNDVVDNFLTKDLNSNDDIKSMWLTIRSKLGTKRSINFLQARYLKLKQNQRLNTKEMSLLADKYDQIPIQKFMIIFPGKTKETLTQLIETFKTKDIQESQEIKKIDEQVENILKDHICSLGKNLILIGLRLQSFNLSLH